MKIIKAGIVKQIEFPNEMAKRRYLDNLRIDGKGHYIINEAGNRNTCFITTIVEPWRNVPLIWDIDIE